MATSPAPLEMSPIPYWRLQRETSRRGISSLFLLAQSSLQPNSDMRTLTGEGGNRLRFAIQVRGPICVVGPAYYRFGGKVLFAVPDLVTWAEARKFDAATEEKQGGDHGA